MNEKLINSLLCINGIFNDCVNNIKDKFRQYVLTPRDAILFRFKYSESDATKDGVSADINIINKINSDPTVYTKKENKVPLSFYQSLYTKIRELFLKDFTGKNYFKCPTLNVEVLKDYQIIVVDGTYSNTNIKPTKGKLDTSLNMGYYDAVNGVPIHLEYKGKKRNDEIVSLCDYFKNNKINDKTIIVADRGYCKYELFREIDKLNGKYVIRIRNNNTLNKADTDAKKYLKEHSRIVEFTYGHIMEVKTKNNITHKININRKYTLITNLMDKNLYPDDLILEIYRKRWSIEVFFKILKQNFNFKNPKEKDPVAYSKLYYIEMIIMYITRMLMNTKSVSYAKDRKLNKLKHIQKQDGTIAKCDINYNISLIITGIYNHLINNIINSTLTKELLTNFIEVYVKNMKDATDRSYPRVSKTPFTKWYVKDYQNISVNEKLVYAVVNNDFSKLNKNQKVLCKQITIIK